MRQMTRLTRLSLIGLLIIGSAIYAALIAKDPEIARSIMVGYIGVVLTIFVANELWKKP